MSVAAREQATILARKIKTRFAVQKLKTSFSIKTSQGPDARSLEVQEHQSISSKMPSTTKRIGKMLDICVLLCFSIPMD